MRFAVGYIAKLRRENADLEVSTRALDSVWTKKTFTGLVPWLRRRVRVEAERVK